MLLVFGECLTRKNILYELAHFFMKPVLNSVEPDLLDSVWFLDICVSIVCIFIGERDVTGWL
jgi:hypothetical protein